MSRAIFSVLRAATVIAAFFALSVMVYWAVLMVLVTAFPTTNPLCDLLCEYAPLDRGDVVATYYATSAPFTLPVALLGIATVSANPYTPARRSFEILRWILLGGAYGAATATLPNVLARVGVLEIGSRSWEVAQIYAVHSYAAAIPVFAFAGFCAAWTAKRLEGVTNRP